MIMLIFLIVSLAVLLTWAWVKGIDDMKNDHPDYKGDDFLDWKGNLPWKDDEWDNHHHNEDV